MPTDYNGGFDEPPPPVNVEDRWYGWQTLTSDAASVGILAASLGDDGTKGGAFVGLFGYLFGAPIIHGLHRQTGKSLGSFVLRAAAPTIGGIVGWESEGCDETNDQPDDGYLCGVEGAMVGVLVGTVVAIVADSALLAHEEVERDGANVPAPSFQMRPDISLSRDQATLQLSGIF